MIGSYLGEFAALAAALAWAVASLLFRRAGTSVPPLVLNLYKGLLAVVVLSAVLLLGPGFPQGIATGDWAILLASGAIGIGIGDTAFFAALNRLGERRTVLMAETLAPPMAAGLAIFVLAEFLGPLALVGIALTLGGVAWVTIEETPTSQTTSPRNRAAGVALGVLAALCQAVGGVLSRLVLVETEAGPLASAVVRITGGVAMLLIWMPAVGQAYLPGALCAWRPWRVILPATLLGTVLGIFLQQTAFAHTEAGIAQTLLATSSLFILPLVMLRGERVSLRAIVGAALAVIGIALFFAVE
ncbi:MAG: EamA family transporter [Planctomycetota bacterium]|nr:MAG: EamA family transporter [Planctomycetota bacterium]